MKQLQIGYRAHEVLASDELTAEFEIGALDDRLAPEVIEEIDAALAEQRRPTRAQVEREIVRKLGRDRR